MINESAIVGWNEIAAMFNRSERKMRSLKLELYSCGTIFYMYVGRPPKKRVCAFPSRLRNWSAIMASQGYVI